MTSNMLPYHLTGPLRIYGKRDYNRTLKVLEMLGAIDPDDMTPEEEAEYDRLESLLSRGVRGMRHNEGFRWPNLD